MTEDHANAVALVEKCKKRIEGSNPGVQVETKVLDGDPRALICSQADETSADYVLVGSRGLSGLTKLLGSISEYVVHHVQAPVLVLRDEMQMH